MIALAVAAALVLAGCGDDSDESSSSPPANGSQASVGDSSSAPPAGATFSFVALDTGGPLTKAALEKGDIDIALLFSSDGAISKNDWVALEDDKELQPVDNFVPAVRTDSATPEVVAVLDAVSEKLTVEAVQELVQAVSIDGQNPDDVAGTFLTQSALPGELQATGTMVVGSANFAESDIAAQVYGQALAAAGVTVDYKPQFGAREAYLPALESGELDLVPEFVGTLLTFYGGNATADLDDTVAEARALAGPKGITLTEPAPADSVNTFVVTQETADRFDLETVSDLAGVTEALVLGGPPECPQRPFCLEGLKGTYGLDFNV